MRWDWDSIVDDLVPYKVDSVYYSYGLEGDHGYTFRLGSVFKRDRIGNTNVVETNSKHDHTIFLHPFESLLAVSHEVFTIPKNAQGFIFPKSSFIRYGVLTSTAVVDAGFHGKLSFPLFNSGQTPVPLHLYEGLAQLVLFERNSEHQYKGKYQEK